MRSGSFRPPVKYGDDTVDSGSAAAHHGRGTVQDLDDTLLRALFASPPSEFVAARNELAKQLRRDKRREEATAVAALRRPGWDDWALNVTAVEQGADVATFADAASAVRSAQAAAIEGRAGPDVRTTLHDLRTATTVLVRHATAVLRRVGRQAGAGELAGRLAEVAASEPAVDQLRIGVLGAGGDAPPELFAGLEPGERAAAPDEEPAPPATETAGRAAPRRAADDDDHDDEEPAPPRRDARAERAEQRRRKEAVQEATRARRDAAKAVDRADAAVDSASTAVRRARRALAEAEQALADATGERAAAASDLEAADAELERARAAGADQPA